MSDHPEDHNLWPSDPFDLLRIKRSDDARTAKRAYFKLIRKYKPDRFPAEFQKIREAYESVESWLSWQSHIETEPDPVAKPDPVTKPKPVTQREQDAPVFERLHISPSRKKTTGSESRFPDEVDENLPNPTDEKGADEKESVYVAEAIDEEPSTPILTDPMDRFFESLNTQGLAAAAEHLRNIDPSNNPEQFAQANLSKYFINRFLPNSATTAQSQASIDAGEVSPADQKRISWLLKSIYASRQSQGAMRELKNEFDLNYRLANCEIFKRHLTKIRDPATLAQLYLLRWEAIGHYQPQIVVTDLQTILPRALEFGGNRGLWMNLVAESLNYTIWHQQQCAAHNEECWREVSEDGQSWTADSVELLMLAAEEWQTMNGTWSAVVPWARTTLPETFRSVWMPVAQEIAVDPRASLDNLGGAYQAFSMTMSLFEEGLQSLSSLNAETESFEQPDWDETRELVNCYFIDVGKTDYSSNRVPIMEFCILNQLSPMSFAAAANSFMSSEEHIGWTDLIKADGPLRCVVNACHAANY